MMNKSLKRALTLSAFLFSTIFTRNTAIKTMSFKKLINPLKDALALRGFDEPLPFQQQTLSKIKGGANMFGIASTGAGKTTSIVLSVIQKLKGEAFGDVPRAIVVVKDKQAALDVGFEFASFSKETDLRVYCAYDENNIDEQKEEIYTGTDVVIITPKRLSKLYFINGINMNNLQLFIVDDAETLFANDSFTAVTRIPDSIGKCQYVVFASKFDKRFEVWQDTFMSNAQVVIL